MEAQNLRFQKDVADAARSAGVEVLVEPLTERLVCDGFSCGLDYADKYPLDLERLTKFGAQAELVERVLSPQHDVATVLVPPH
ncbi:MAG: hypothetical protein WD229_01005, partial [Pirellulales bacterium]